MGLPRVFTQSECVEFYEKRNLQYRPMREADLKDVDDFYRAVHFDVGYHNTKLYYDVSPDTWYVVRDKNDQVIIAEGCNQMPNGILYAYVTMVREDYRGRGLMKALMLDTDKTAMMASSMEDSIDRKLTPKYWLEKRHGFTGFCKTSQTENLLIPHIPGVIMEKLTPKYIDRLLAYDQKIVLTDRNRFVREWSMPEDISHGETVLAINEMDGTCLGYATMRLFSDYYGIQPLYAENDQIAMALMIACTKRCFHQDSFLYMPIMAGKRIAIEFCTNFGMMITNTEMRNCTESALQYAKSLPCEKVYSVHEYYPV